MGEQAEYMINGDDCQECGEYIGDGPGYPRSCAGCGGGSQGGPGDGSGKRRRAKRRRQRIAQRRRDALATADVTGWTQLNSYHYRRTVDGKVIDWWPSTGKWAMGGKIHPGGLNEFLKGKI